MTLLKYVLFIIFIVTRFIQDIRGEAEMKIYEKLNLRMDEFLGLGMKNSIML